MGSSPFFFRNDFLSTPGPACFSPVICSLYFTGSTIAWSSVILPSRSLMPFRALRRQQIVFVLQQHDPFAPPWDRRLPAFHSP